MEGDDVVRSPFRVPLLALKGEDGIRERELSDLVSERCDLGFLYDNSFFQVGDGFPESPFRFGELLRLGADTAGADKSSGLVKQHVGTREGFRQAGPVGGLSC
ncbi:hypothetical protein, partial [Streptomyces sp. NPDC002346]